MARAASHPPSPIPPTPAERRRASVARAATWARRELARIDPLLVTLGRSAEPAALVAVVATGLALPWLEGEWAPVPACRTLHVFGGIVLAALLVYRGVAAAVAGLRAAWRRQGTPRSAAQRSGRRDRWRAALVEGLYTAALLAMVVTGLDHAWALRAIRTGGPGVTLSGWLTPAQALTLHSLGAPYFYGTLLLLSYLRGRSRARALLAELRAP